MPSRPSAGEGTSRDGRGVAIALARDPLVRLQLATTGAVALAYLLPTPRAWLVAFADNWLCVPFVLWAPAACLANVRAAAADERTAWKTMGWAFAWWLAALVVYAMLRQPGGLITRVEDVLVTGLYLGFYVTLLLAIERKPHLPAAQRETRTEWRLRALGATGFVSGWMLYVIVVRLGSGGDTTTPILDSVMFVLLDLVVVVRLLVAAHDSRPRSWRWCYAGLAGATTLLLVTDSLNVFIGRDLLVMPSGQPADLLWALPGLAFVPALRLRAHVVDDATIEASDSLPTPVGLGVYLMLGAVGFPMLHLLLEAFGVVPVRPTWEYELLAVVGTGAAFMASLAVIAYRLLEAQRARVQQDRQVLEAQLLEARKMEAVGRLAGGIAHDFNNLLTAIGGYNDLVVDTLDADDPNREMLLQVRLAANRAAGVTKQLLAFARRQIVKPTAVDVNTVVLEFERMLRPLLGEQIAMEMRLDREIEPALVDRGQLEQVLLNLAVNARDAMPRGGTLTLATSGVGVTALTRPHGTSLPPGDYVSIAVSDTGVGIPSQDLPHIFEPFFTTKAREKGTGLGLATVYGIVAQSGGVITVSTEAGRGTSFTVYVPVARDVASTRVETPRLQPIAGGRETVLLAEDDVTVRALARRTLEQRGYAVLEATTAPDAVRLACEHDGPIALLLTDVVMPELSGPEVADRVQAARVGIRVLFMSGYADTTTARQLVDEGRELLPKPFTPDVLAARVRRVLDAAGPAVVVADRRR